MALAPCAYSMTVNVTGNRLNAILNQRSQDVLAANAWNLSQYALLLVMFAQVSGLEAGELVHVIADAHIYDRHVPIIQELIQQPQHDAPKLVIEQPLTDFYAVSKNDFKLDGYTYNEFDRVIEVAI